MIRALKRWDPKGLDELPTLFRSSVVELEKVVGSLVLFSRNPTENSKVVVQTAHGATTILEFWGHDGTDWVKAQATSSGESALGMTIDIPGVDFLTLAVAGWQTVPAHGFTIGKHWLSTTVAGATQTTAPGPGDRVEVVMQVVDVDNFILFPKEMLP